LQISTKSTTRYNSCFKNGTQKQKLPIWKIPVSLLTARSVTFQQDNVPAHRAGDTVEFLSRNTPDFISPWLWLLNSPDLNPVDYEVCGVLQQHVYRSRIRDVDHLKQRLIEEWRCFDQNIIDRAVRQWRVRLRACLRKRQPL